MMKRISLTPLLLLYSSMTAAMLTGCSWRKPPRLLPVSFYHVVESAPDRLVLLLPVLSALRMIRRRSQRERAKRCLRFSGLVEARVLICAKGVVVDCGFVGVMTSSACVSTTQVRNQRAFYFKRWQTDPN